MTYSSVIRNFANIGIPQAEKLREQLSLSMSVQMLKSCGKHYKEKYKRDPFVDELKMLDMLLCARESDSSFLALTELFTNDAFVARTYSDLLKKRGQIWPQLERPCTLYEAANMATTYIRRAKGENPGTHPLPSIENLRDAITYPDVTCVAAPNSAYRMRLLPLSCTEIAEGDALILMAPEADDTQNAFRRKSAALLRNKTLMQYVKGTSMVGNGGILQELLKITDGAAVYLSALSPIGTSVPLTTLCQGFEGCHILRVSSHQWNIVTAFLAKGGVRALPFASIKKEPKFVFCRDKNTSFFIDTYFLRTVNRSRTISAKLLDESLSAPDAISFGGIGGGKCSYLAPEIALQIGEVAEMDSTACVAASSSPINAPYKTALWSVLAPVASLSLCGVPYSNQALSIALELPEAPTDETTVGKCTSLILGLYRAQMELGLDTAGSVSIRSTKDLKDPCVSVWASSQNVKKTASTFAKSGSSVYAVTPTLDAEGLPDFAALRQLLNRIAKFADEGKILSSRVLVGEAITDGIRKMSNTHTCVLSDKTVAADGKLPLCILIESEEELPPRYIGKVHPFKKLQQEAIALPERTELIACEKPDIVIVSSPMDNDAMALAAHLEEYGAHVSLFTEPQKDAVALARATLTTQTLILAQNALLPQNKQMDFALESLRRAGGNFLSLSKGTVPEGFVSLKNGIDREILQKICL